MSLVGVLVALVVQKFGGTSLATTELIIAAAKRVAETKHAGNRVVVVCSAPGDTTDDLISLAKRVCDSPRGRELDALLSTGEIQSAALMALALKGMGLDAVSLTGEQAGIITDGVFNRARITAIETSRLQAELADDKIVIVAGYQGIANQNDVATLGRGGSDATAVALATALGADVCEIFTDVEGVASADPRIVPHARKIDHIDYDEMLQLARLGGKVMQERSIEIAAAHDTVLVVRSSFSQAKGTTIAKGYPLSEGYRVRAIAHEDSITLCRILEIPDTIDILDRLLSPLAEASMAVDLLQVAERAQGTIDLSFTIDASYATEMHDLLREPLRHVGVGQIMFEPGWGIVSVVGRGLQSAFRYPLHMFQCLEQAGIPIKRTTISDTRVSCLIRASQIRAAVTLLHDDLVSVRHSA